MLLLKLIQHFYLCAVGRHRKLLMRRFKTAIAIIISFMLLFASSHESIMHLDPANSTSIAFDFDDTSEKNEAKNEIELEKLHGHFWPRFLSEHVANLVSTSYHQLAVAYLDEHSQEIPTPPPKGTV